jgi:hypothetical protein
MPKSIVKKYKLKKSNKLKKKSKNTKNTKKYRKNKNKNRKKTLLLGGTSAYYESVKRISYLSDTGRAYVDKFISIFNKTVDYSILNRNSFSVNKTIPPIQNFTEVIVFGFDQTLMKEHWNEITKDIINKYRQLILNYNHGFELEKLELITFILTKIIDLNDVGELLPNGNYLPITTKEQEINCHFAVQYFKRFKALLEKNQIGFAISSFGYKIVIIIILCYFLNIIDIVNISNIEIIKQQILLCITDDLINNPIQTLNKDYHEIFITTPDDYYPTSEDLTTMSPETDGKNISLDLITKIFNITDKKNLMFFDDDINNITTALADGYILSHTVNPVVGFKSSDLQTLIDMNKHNSNSRFTQRMSVFKQILEPRPPPYPRITR